MKPSSLHALRNSIQGYTQPFPKIYWITFLIAIFLAPQASATLLGVSPDEEYAVTSIARNGGYVDTLIDGEAVRVVHAGKERGCTSVGIIFTKSKRIETDRVCGNDIRKSSIVAPKMPDNPQVEVVIEGVRSAAVRTGVAVQQWEGYMIAARRAMQGFTTSSCTPIETLVTWQGDLVMHSVGDHCNRPGSNLKQ